MKKYIVEFVGTFFLAFLVSLSITGSIPVVTPVLAGLVVMFFVYTIGPVSGCHLNPAITLGLLSVKKISPKDAVGYLVVQFVGAYIALYVTGMFFDVSAGIGAFATNGTYVLWGELVGAFLFAFGLVGVVYGSVDKNLSGIVIGASLLVGILCASLIGSNGVLNPAVALGIQSFNLTYLLAPIVGSVLGMQFYKFITSRA